MIMILMRFYLFFVNLCDLYKFIQTSIDLYDDNLFLELTTITETTDPFPAIDDSWEEASGDTFHQPCEPIKYGEDPIGNAGKFMDPSEHFLEGFQQALKQSPSLDHPRLGYYLSHFFSIPLPHSETVEAPPSPISRSISLIIDCI